MTGNIRQMLPKDRDCVLAMMQDFYASPAVFTEGSQEIFINDIDNCLCDNPFVEGYIIEKDGNIAGYAMIAKSWSTEFGKPCIWIEDLYLKEPYRGQGLGKHFFAFLTARYTDCIFRLEVEPENEPAVRLYRSSGFTVLPYTEMKKECAKQPDVIKLSVSS